jgi:hypothetical protein
LAPCAFAADPGAPDAQEAAPAAPASPPPANLKAVTGRPGANDTQIEYGALGAPDTSQVGIMGQSEGGLPANMWQGTPYSTAAALLAEGPPPTRSRALQDLTRSLLLSEASLPGGGGDGPSLLALRLKRLLGLGEFDAVLQLSNPIQPSAKYDAEERVRAEAFLLQGDEAGACGLTQKMRLAVADPYWAKLGAFCDVRKGDIPAAELAVGLLKSRGYEDATFYALYDWLVIPPSKDKPAPPPKKAKGKKGAKAAKAVKPEPPRTPPTGDGTPLSFAMLRAANLPVGDLRNAGGRPAMLHALALEGAGAPPATRLQAALEATAYGALPPESLRAMIAQGGAQDAEDGAMALIPLIRAVDQASTPAERAQRAAEAYHAAVSSGYGPMTAALLAPTLQSLAPEPGLAIAAPDLTVLALAAGDVNAAYGWFGVIAAKAGEAETAGRDYLANLLRIAEPSQRLAWTTQEASRQITRTAEGRPGALAQRAFEIRLLEALGTPVEPETLNSLPPATPVIGSALPAFQDAVAGGRVAEAVLRIFPILGADGPGSTPQGAVVEVVRGLKQLGLLKAARAVALEAALAPRS